MKLNRNELLIILKYYSYINDNFICDLHLYESDELKKLIKYYHIDIDEKLDEDVLKNALRFYDQNRN
jgi:hypothetical protein